MRCTVAPIKSSKAPSARCPKLKMPDSVFKPGICGKLQQLATPNLQNLGLWEVGSLKLCDDAPVTKQTPRFRCPASHALEFPCGGFNLPIKNETQKKDRSKTPRHLRHLPSILLPSPGLIGLIPSAPLICHISWI